MRRLALLVAVGATWLFLAALPVLADGGPHIGSINSGGPTPPTGVTPLTADTCAGCHRAHTAQGQYLINGINEEALCASCHGPTATGATTDVFTGVQYVPAAGTGLRTAPQLGALRAGGFEQARISSGAPSRWFRSLTSAALQQAKVQVLDTPQAVTSAHLNLHSQSPVPGFPGNTDPGNGLNLPTVAWGNGVAGSGAGPTVDLTCASCHNPHGNGQYRILNPVPEADGTGFVAASSGVTVQDSPMGTWDATNKTFPTKNYTIIQTKPAAPTGPSDYTVFASQVTAVPGYTATAGDYWHVRVPWDDATGIMDAPNGRPSGAQSFNNQIVDWCLACHTRYYSESGFDDQGDPIYKYAHQVTSSRACTTCHVAHGSNAQMAGPFSSTYTYPGQTTGSNSSRLLKVDNRGTCQLCHDPTRTPSTPINVYSGPLPIPGRP